jgi:hypothetical protein
MTTSIHGTKKSRGRPKSTGTGTQIGMRWQEPELKAIDDWRRKQPDLPSRAEAIRRLTELGLKVAKLKQPLTADAVAKADQLAGEAIDRMSDKSASDEERASRKRRLLKGPKGLR